jgi:hypothetical protein
MHTGTDRMLSLQRRPWITRRSDIAAELLFPQHSSASQFLCWAAELANCIWYQFLALITNCALRQSACCVFRRISHSGMNPAVPSSVATVFCSGEEKPRPLWSVEMLYELRNDRPFKVQNKGHFMYPNVYREAVQPSVRSTTCLCGSLRPRLSPIRHRLLFITGTEFVYCAVRAEALNLVSSIPRCAMAQTVSPRPLATEARVRSPVSSCEIRGGKTCTGTDLSPITSVFLCQYHSTNTSYSSLSAYCSYQKGKWAKPGFLVTSSAISEMVAHSIEKYFHSFFESLNG